MTTAVDSFLAHYGVRGMKWGVSREGNKVGSRKRVEREPYSDEAAKTSNTHSRVKAQKSTKMLTNKELQDAITRMNLEQQYSRMTNGLDKTTQQKATAFMANMLGTSAKQAGQQFANDQMKQLVNQSGGKKK